MVHIRVEITPGTYGTQGPFHMACGIDQVQGFQITFSNTTQSSVSVEAGLKIEGVVNFGLTWGANQTVTVTTTNSVDFTGVSDVDQRVWQRYFKYDAVYSLEPLPVFGFGCNPIQESETIFTVGNQQKTLNKSCGICEE